MTPALLLAAAFCAAFLLIHLASIAIAAMRCRAPAAFLPPPPDAPAVTIVRPVCGIENNIVETLRSSFRLDYPCYEVVFCVSLARDPVCSVVRDLIAAHPDVPARLLIGDDRISDNPKLNNCVKGWHAAAHDWIVLADSNVLMPPDYLPRLLARWDETAEPRTGLVCSPPVGVSPDGFAAHLECAFLNGYQARWQYFADTLGCGFAQGKTMLWRRDLLESAGGIPALAAEMAEDAASTKVVRAAGRVVRLVDAPFAQPLGRRNLRDVWRRQARWSRLRRSSFPAFFYPELFSGALFPLLAFLFVVASVEGPLVLGAAAFLAIWYGAEATLAQIAGWPCPLTFPLHAIARDLLLPALWVDALLGDDFEWRGNAMTVAERAG